MNASKFLKYGLAIGAPATGYAIASTALLEQTRWLEEAKGGATILGGVLIGAALAERMPKIAAGILVGGMAAGGVSIAKGLRFRAYLSQLATPTRQAANTPPAQPGALPTGADAAANPQTTPASAGVYRR